MTSRGGEASGPVTAAERLSSFWDSSRAYYEQAAAANAQLAPERSLLLTRLAGGERLLDLGCGSCENALWLPESVRYVGLDVSTVALRMASEQGRPGARVRGSAAALPFASASFDAVLSTWVLEHLHDPGAVFAEVGRVLRPGGLLLLVGSAWALPYEMPPSLAPRRRVEVALRRLARQLRVAVTGEHLFDIVREPRVLAEGYVPDSDAVYVAQGYVLGRYLAALGLEIEELRALPHRPDPGGLRGMLRRLLRRLPLWRHGWGNLLVVARRDGRPEPARAHYRLAYL